MPRGSWRSCSGSEVRDLVKDLVIGLGLALLVVALLLFASFNATFIYRGF